MSKEDRYSHLIPLDEIMCCFSPYCRHTTQTMVIKAGKSGRLCWDGLTTIKPTDIVMNQVTPFTREAPITFEHVKMQLYINIYNTRVSYPTFIILLAMADVKACFCFPHIHADLTGTFGFLARGLLQSGHRNGLWIHCLHIKLEAILVCHPSPVSPICALPWPHQKTQEISRHHFLGNPRPSS
jgi:hypothetical protein